LKQSQTTVIGGTRAKRLLQRWLHHRKPPTFFRRKFQTKPKLKHSKRKHILPEERNKDDDDDDDDELQTHD
jgi:hypothetical protein